MRLQSGCLNQNDSSNLWERVDAFGKRAVVVADMWESASLINETYIADAPAQVEEAMKQMKFERDIVTL